LPLPVTERLLGHLRDGHLLEQRPSGRYHWHDLLRSFAAGEVASELTAEDRMGALTRLVETELHAAEAADRLLAPSRYRRDVTFAHPPTPARVIAHAEAALTWFRAEWPNLVALCRTAFERGLHTYCWQLAFSLRSFFYVAKLWDSWIESHEIALAAAVADEDRWAQAMTMNNVGLAFVDHGDLDGAEDHYLRALTLFSEIDDQHGVHTTTANQAWVDHYRGDYASALGNLLAALEYYRSTGAIRNAAITLRGVALVETALGEYDQAIAHAEEALRLVVDVGLDVDISMAHNCLGWAWFRAGDLAAADKAYATALASCDRSGSTYEAARAETGLGNVAAAAGRSADARQLWAAADERQVLLDPVVVGEERARRELPR
jgi:tetratricopeptide (TPR) repeat protein